MAGSIPPLVSSTPPPLCAFDDEEEEEEEDEFRMYTAAEDIEFNECISFKESNEEKQSGGNCRGDQDSTSQDSATDSGLCPDSESVSPTPHSDDERTVKHSATSACHKLYQQPTDIAELANNRNPVLDTEDLNSSTIFAANTALPNGHINTEDSEDDFGNFENFEPTQVEASELNLSSQEEKQLQTNSTDISEKEEISLNMEIVKVQDDKDTNETLESLNNDNLEIEGHVEISTVNEICSDIDHKQISVSVFSAPGTRNTNGELQSLKEECISLDKCEIGNDYSIISNKQNSEIKSKIDECDQEDDEFANFDDFQADFSSFNGPNDEQCDNFSEHSKPSGEQKQLEETVKVYVPSNDASDDEFSDFTEFSSSDGAFVSAQKSNSVEQISNIPISCSDKSDVRTDSEFQDWISVFPSCSSDAAIKEGDVVILGDNDSVWSRLIPMESSPALSYQWAESQANRHLLSALNIDSRNILMMPWMPKFAANLSGGPLQPVKALEPLHPTPAPVATPVHISSGPESVPDAHFDWDGSGLTNPLDCPKPVLKLHKAPSAEAEAILSSLPDLSFMRKAYIDFPINKG